MLNLEKSMSSTVHAHAQGEIQSKPRDTQPRDTHIKLVFYKQTDASKEVVLNAVHVNSVNFDGTSSFGNLFISL